MNELPDISIIPKIVQLPPKTRLGSYEIQALLGVGGMGEVYRAHDQKLERDVAIKILPAAFGQDSERVRRFQREAQVLASLNHPNIGVIHDLQEISDTHFLVLELVEGETLAQRLKRGRLPIDEALELCGQIAEALEAAHEKDVLHRDLKPANIQITPTGRVKVLDFGLAKVLQPEASSLADSKSPTVMASWQSGKGVILGTAAYMSPEQARGRVLDRGADMWAFGCVLFEALTGEQAFKGEDLTEILANVVKGEPDWKLLRADTPVLVRSLLRQCLQKQPQQRFRDAGALRVMLKDAAAQSSIAAVHAGVRPTTGIAWKRMIPVVTASVLVGALSMWFLMPSAIVERAVTRVLLDVRPAELFPERSSRPAITLSPDGRTVVFSAIRGGVTQLFKRRLDESEAIPMTGTEQARGPFFSPDGQWIAFWSDNKLKKAPLAGGPPVEICDVPADSRGLFGAHWGSDDTIVFSARGDGIAKVQSGGGTPAVVTKGDAQKSEGRHILPHLLPGGKAILYTAAAALTDWEQTNIVAQSLETGERRVLIRGGSDPRYVSTGHLLYLKYGTLMAVAFDARRLELLGSPVAMLDNVMQAINPPSFADETGTGQFSVSENGTLAFIAGGVFPTPRRDLLWVDRKGRATVLPIKPAPYFAPQVSPDGKRIAFHAVRERAREYLMWVYDIGRQTTTRLTLEGDNAVPVWSPNSRNLAFRSVISGVFHLALLPADGTGAPQLLTTSQYNQIPSSWSASANVLAFMENHDSINQIWVLPMDGDRKPKPFLRTPFSLSYASFSADGRWIAYTSSESGSEEVYVQPYPGPGEKIRISTDGGHSPAWAKNGRELFFQKGPRDPVQMMAVDIDTAKQFQSGRPRLLFEGPYGVNGPMRGYDVTPDGEHFVLTGRTAGETPEPPFTQMHIVLNWTEELKRRVAVK